MKTSQEIFSENLRNLMDAKNLKQAAAYTAKSAELQRIIAELEKTPKEITHKFTSNWKDLYQELDREHKRSFWRNLIQGIEIDENAKPIKILY